MKDPKPDRDFPDLDRLIELTARTRSLDALALKIAADARLLRQLRLAQGLLERRRPDEEARLNAACQKYGLAVSRFDHRVLYLAHVLGVSPCRDDPYAVLGLSRNASAQEIKRAFRTLSLEWHPDRNPGRVEEAAAMFRKIREAYAVLSDPALRRRLSAPPPSIAPVPPCDDVGEDEPSGFGRAGSRRFAGQLAALVAILLGVTFLADFQNWLTPRRYPAKTSQGQTASVVAEDPKAVSPPPPSAAPQATSPEAPRPHEAMHEAPALPSAAPAPSGPPLVRAGGAPPAEGPTRPQAAPATDPGPARKEPQPRLRPASRAVSAGGKEGRAERPSPVQTRNTGDASSGAGPYAAAVRPRNAGDPASAGGAAPALPRACPVETAVAPNSPPAKASPSSSQRKSPSAGGAVATVSAASLEERIRGFIDRYCRTYAQKDLDGFLRLFSSDALENGTPVQSLRPTYEATFSRVTDLAYRIDVDRWVWSQGGVTVYGRFHIQVRFQDRHGAHSRGTVTLGLEPEGESFRVRSLQYAFVNAETF
ncbi:MAG: DnaJ domain-containing protein [Desulfosoma sp.]